MNRHRGGNTPECLQPDPVPPALVRTLRFRRNEREGDAENVLAGDRVTVMDHEELRLAIGIPQQDANFVGAYIVRVLNDLD